jgi:phosphate transport system substrate-binding protein
MRVLLLVAVALALAGTKAACGTEVSVHGSSTVMNTIMAPRQAEIEKLSDQQLRIAGNGSQRGIADLLDGRAQIAMISAPLAEEVRRFNQKAPGSIDISRFREYQIGESQVAFAVHPSNAVRTLTNGQLVEIFTGRVTNWKKLGGTDQAIVIVTAQPGDGLRSMVESALLGNANLPDNVRAMTNATQIAKVVAQLPGGIGIVAQAALDGSVRELRTDKPITQPLILVTVDEETSEVRRVVAAAIAVGKLPCSHTRDGAEARSACDR